MKKAIIFDMDGLMIDSERVTYEEYTKTMKKFNYPFDKSFYIRCLGKNRTTICQLFTQQYGEEFPMQEIWEDVHLSLDDRLTTSTPLKNGIVELLTYLKDHHYKTIVATSSSKERAEKILAAARLRNYFDDIICGDEVTCGKPHPEIFLTACQKLGVTPDEALVLEDSEAGITAAHCGGIDVICIPDMKYPEEEFANKTLKIVTSLHDVITHLQ